MILPVVVFVRKMIRKEAVTSPQAADKHIQDLNGLPLASPTMSPDKVAVASSTENQRVDGPTNPSVETEIEEADDDRGVVRERDVADGIPAPTSDSVPIDHCPVSGSKVIGESSRNVLPSSMEHDNSLNLCEPVGNGDSGNEEKEKDEEAPKPINADTVEGPALETLDPEYPASSNANYGEPTNDVASKSNPICNDVIEPVAAFSKDQDQVEKRVNDSPNSIMEAVDAQPAAEATESPEPAESTVKDSLEMDVEGTKVHLKESESPSPLKLQIWQMGVVWILKSFQILLISFWQLLRMMWVRQKNSYRSQSWTPISIPSNMSSMVSWILCSKRRLVSTSSRWTLLLA